MIKLLKNQIISFWNLKLFYFICSHWFSFFLPLAVICCHLLWLLSPVVIRCHSLSQLSFIVTCCTTRRHSLYHSLPLVAIRCITRCHWCTTRQPLYKRYVLFYAYHTFLNLHQEYCCVIDKCKLLMIFQSVMLTSKFSTFKNQSVNQYANNISTFYIK